MTQDFSPFTDSVQSPLLSPSHWYDFIRDQTFLYMMFRVGAVILLSIIALVVVRRLIISIMKRIMSRTISRNAAHESARQNTLIRIIDYSLRTTIWTLTILTCMSIVGINVGPLLATAGVAGLAIGFGAQYLVKDVISGFFIILENQYVVGDVACIGTVCGSVEDVSLRKTVLRDMNGTVHVIPNGEIRLTSNMTRDFSRINIDFRLPLEADVVRASEVIDEMGKSMSQEAAFESKIRIAPHFLRIEDVTDSAVLVKIVGEVVAGAQWEVSGEVRKRLIEKLHTAGVGPAYPRRVVFQAEEKSDKRSSKKNKKAAS